MSVGDTGGTLPNGTPAGHWGPWTAIFLDGPCSVEERHFATGPIHTVLQLIPHPTGRAGYALVGYEGLEPEHPWPGQVRYALVEVLAAADGEPIARYLLEEAPR